MKNVIVTVSLVLLLLAICFAGCKPLKMCPANDKNYFRKSQGMKPIKETNQLRDWSRDRRP